MYGDRTETKSKSMQKKMKTPVAAAAAEHNMDFESYKTESSHIYQEQGENGVQQSTGQLPYLMSSKPGSNPGETAHGQSSKGNIAWKGGKVVLNQNQNFGIEGEGEPNQFNIILNTNTHNYNFNGSPYQWAAKGKKRI